MVPALPRTASIGAMIVAIVLAACGSDGPGTDDPADSQGASRSDAATPSSAVEPGEVDLESLDACQLVAASAVEGAVGMAVEPAPIDEPGLVGCAFSSDSGTPVTVLVGESFINPDAAEVPTGTEEVSGIGDLAYWNPPFNRLQFISDGYDVQVTVTIDGGDPRAVAETIGSAVAGSLP